MAKVDNIIEAGLSIDTFGKADKKIQSLNKTKGFEDAMLSAGQSISVDKIKSVSISPISGEFKVKADVAYTFKAGGSSRDGKVSLCFDLKLNKFTDVMP